MEYPYNIFQFVPMQSIFAHISILKNKIEVLKISLTSINLQIVIYLNQKTDELESYSYAFEP